MDLPNNRTCESKICMTVLKEFMYTKNDIEPIRVALIKAKQTLAVAESVTSGHLQAAISLATDASQFFQGGITTYNLGQKSRHLFIDPVHADACNCVSSQIASSMSIQVSKMFSSNWGLAITGYAAPAPEFKVSKAFAYCAISFNNKIMLARKINPNVSAGRPTQEYYVKQVLKYFSGCL